MYNQQYQQPPQLPFNPQQPQNPVLNISYTNPPFVPNVAVDPQFQPWLPAICAAAAMEIQNKHRNNPLRMFMFNQYGYNNFANVDFEGLVGGTIDFIKLGFAERAYNNIEQAIGDAVPKMVEMLCAANLKHFQALDQFIDQNTRQNAHGAIAFFENVKQKISYMYNRMGGGAPMAGGYPPQQGGGYSQQGFGGQRGPGNNVPASMGARFGQGGTGALFNQQGNQGAGSGGPGTGRNMAGGKWDNPQQSQADVLKQPHSGGRMQQEATEVETPTVMESEELPAADNLLLWKPSNAHPYIPAYNPYKYELFLKPELDGTVTPVLKERTIDLEYERHGINTVFGELPPGVAISINSDALTRITTGVEKMDAAKELGEDSPEIKAFIKKDFIAETSDTSAWFIGSLERLTAENGRTPDVYRAYAFIADPAVSFADESDAVKNFGSSKTYIELREKLNASAGEISPELWGIANLKMTNAINRILAQNLSIPGVSIASFATDIQDVLEHLPKHYGSEILKAFLAHQKEVIHATFQVMGEETARNLTQAVIRDEPYPEGGEPKVTYLASTVSLTYLNCLSHELQVDLVPGSGAALHPAITPELHAVVKNLFKDTDSMEGIAFDRHLIRTNDGRVLEATRGYLGVDFFLLTLVK